jgi:hypothetical protein
MTTRSGHAFHLNIDFSAATDSAVTGSVLPMLWRANLKITLGFTAPSFWSVSGTVNEDRRDKQGNRYDDDLFVHGLTHKSPRYESDLFSSSVFDSWFGA